MKNSELFDLLVIGGGSGGVATAQRAAQYGARVALIEQDRLGGTCVNLGCVPKKVMWQAAQLAHAFADAKGYGFSAEPATLDWHTLVKRREHYIHRLNEIYARRLEEKSVVIIRGHARFVNPQTIEVNNKHFSAPHILIATGGKPRWPDAPGAELGITSDGFFALEQKPARVAIAGSGYIAVELAGMLNAYGVDTTLLLRKDHVLKGFDDMLGKALLTNMHSAGIHVITNTEIEKLEQDGDSLRTHYKKTNESAVFDSVIWAIGRAANTAELALEKTGVELDEQGLVAVNDYQDSNVEGIYAVGDVTGKFALTPVAIAAGRRLADRLFGGQPDRHLDYHNIPTVVFSHPPIGSVGLSETAAREHYGESVQVFTHHFIASYYGMLDHKSTSCMKLVCTGDENRIVGAHVIGKGADEMLQGFAVAVRMGATKRDFDDTVAIHITSAEEFVTMPTA